jgi:serine/threonine protein kinase
MHRDVNPANIKFRTKTDRSVKLVDFGVAQYAEGHPCFIANCGTPGFVAPEVIRFR